ncbi:ictacalcin-like [Toxotes jaculatrix]|uniref:ictacalcin-like n=1 Tax=Toxotes jaculatrix TaxID=941984 RepID=UPI001B3B065E|nr:ictacalcin-like [Toxotes jaculatrix]
MSLLKAMEVLMATFNKYAGKEGDAKTLTKSELTDLLRNEFFGGQIPDKATVEQFFSDLDNDKSGVVDFKEYATFVAALTMVFHECAK